MQDGTTAKRELTGGFHPFWFWNGKVEEGELRWQIGEMARAGVKGFYIHSRQGLEVPYLSERFLDLVETAIEEAGKHGMVVHLYDECPYPSGAAGGQAVLGSPELLGVWLHQNTFDVPGGRVRLELDRGKVLCCTAYPLRAGQVVWDEGVDLRQHVGTVLAEDTYQETGLTAYNRKRYFGNRSTPVLECELGAGAWRVYVSTQGMYEHFKYFYWFPDVFNPAAVQRFLELTHERYARRFGKEFGGRVGSIFTDETEGYWSARLPGAFAKEYGYDLLASLPALQDERHPQHLKVTGDLWRLAHRMFVEAWEQPMAEWCRSHGLRYGGEKGSRRLSQLAWMDLPGCEPGHTKAGAKPDLLKDSIRGNARATASAAYFYGKEGAQCECYHSMGWAATLQDAKLIAEGLLLHGVKYLVPHGFFYTSHNLRKHDAPPSFFVEMPYWGLFGKLSTRVDRILQAFAGTHVEAEVVVVEPSSGLPTGPQRAEYVKLLEGLMGARVEFLIVDTDILEAGTVADGRVRMREVEARVVVLPPMREVEGALGRWLENFARAGGVVVKCLEDGAKQAVEAVRKGVGESLRLRGAGGVEGLQVVRRRSAAGRRVWMVLNPTGKGLELEIEAGEAVREVALSEEAPGLLRREGDRYVRRVEGFESFLLETTGAGSGETGDGLERVRAEVGGPMSVRALDKNVLRMGAWRMGLVEEGREIQVVEGMPAMPLVNQLKEGRIRFAPAMGGYFGAPPTLSLPKLRVRYGYRFECGFAGRVELVMEPGSIVGEWQVRVNNGPELRAADFQPTGAHVRGSVGVEVTKWLRAGKNEVVVEVETDRVDGGLRNPLYLAGDFAVRTEGKKTGGRHKVAEVLEVLPERADAGERHPLYEGVGAGGGMARLVAREERGRFEDYEGNGLPFYSGAIEYDTRFGCGEVKGARVWLELGFPTGFEEAAEVSVNGGPWRAAAWSPRMVTIDRGELRVGENNLKVRVYTSRIRSFEGQRFSVEKHCYEEV